MLLFVRLRLCWGRPDIIRTLQLTPGVSAGTEGISGLYVRGGNSDENLFLVDGNPVYQVNHIGGFFSAFNNEAIKGMNFFKAGFPARLRRTPFFGGGCAYQGGEYERVSWSRLFRVGFR